MALSLEMVAQEALNLPTRGRALLVEKLLASLLGKQIRRLSDPIWMMSANAALPCDLAKRGSSTVHKHSGFRRCTLS